MPNPQIRITPRAREILKAYDENPSDAIIKMEARIRLPDTSMTQALTQPDTKLTQPDTTIIEHLEAATKKIMKAISDESKAIQEKARRV
jgi:hypothetical protein